MEDLSCCHHLIERVLRLLEFLHTHRIEADQLSGAAARKELPRSISSWELDAALEIISFIDKIPGGFLVYYASGGEHIIYANEGLLRIFQCETMEDLRKYTHNSFQGLVYPEDLDRVEKSIWDQIANSQYDLDYVEYRIRRKDGSIRWIEDYGHFVRSETMGDLFYVFLADATEKREQRILEQQAHEQKLQTLIQKYDQELTLINQEHLRRLEVIEGLSINYESICYVNLDRDEILPYRLSVRTSVLFEGRFQPRKFSTYVTEYNARWVHPEDRARVEALTSPEYIQKHLVENQTYYLNYRVIVNGELQYIQLRLVNVGHQKQGLQVVLGYRRVDEEVRKEMEQKQLLAEALEKANLAINAKKTFLSNMSHDMRTPLNAIFGFTALAKRSLNDPTAAGEYLEQVEEASHKMLDMIAELLEVSDRSGAAGPREVECSLGSVLQEIYTFLLPQAQEKNIDFCLNHQNVCHDVIYADQEKLQQLVMYLVNNAVTYTNSGGKVSISLAEGEELPNYYAVYRLTVSDTGSGIGEEFLARIFEPFSREKNTTLSGVHGVGLGLTIAKNLVDMMGGTIDAKSKIGQGSTFTVTFRFRFQPLSGTRLHGGNAVQPSASRRILLAEDNELNREIETELLENMGFVIDPVENGQLALERMENASPGDYDLIIMDLQMPVMDGWTASASIRRLPDPALSKIPIIALSANVLADDRRKSKECGIDYHLTKPINLPSLLDAIEEITGLPLSGELGE